MWFNEASRKAWTPVLLVSLIVCTLHGNAQSTSPHIVLIVADDLGWNDVGFHGSEIATPIIDDLAANGVELNNYYVQPICTPSRMSLLTGRYVVNLGRQHGHINPPAPSGMPLTATTLSSALQTEGYATRMVGKWHLGFFEDDYTPTNRGFDSFYGFLNGAENHNTHRRRYITTINGTDYRMNGLDLYDGTTVDTSASGTYSTELFTDKGIEVIEAHALSNTSDPLFLYMAYQAPHTPLQVPKRYEKPYSAIVNDDRRTYAGMVAALDEGIGLLVESLVDNNMWNDTILIFTSDNGGQVSAGGNNWPLRGWKGDLWDGGIRAVCFVNSPLYSSPTSPIYHGLVHVSDWFPTILNLAGGNTTGMTLDSYDVWSAITTNSTSPRTELLHNIDPRVSARGTASNASTFDSSTRAALRVDEWKLVTGDAGIGNIVEVPTEATINTTEIYTDNRVVDKNVWLFNMDDDPYEETDLSATYPSIVSSMLDKLLVYETASLPVFFPDDDADADPAVHGDVWEPWL